MLKYMQTLPRRSGNMDLDITRAAQFFTLFAIPGLMFIAAGKGTCFAFS